MRKLLFLLLLAFALSLLPACRQSAPLAPEEPGVLILSPGEGETLPSGDVKVRIYLQNFSLAQNAGQSDKTLSGHAVYYLDVSPPLKADEPATTAPGTFAVSTETSHTWASVPAGKHIFSVQLVSDNDTPLLPPVVVRVNITVK